MANNKGSRGARYLARQSGQIVPSNGKKALPDGTIITKVEILPDKQQGVVRGIAPNGSTFSITMPLALVGL